MLESEEGVSFIDLHFLGLGEFIDGKVEVGFHIVYVDDLVFKKYLNFIIFFSVI